MLYKYVSFDHKYWADISNTEMIYFPTMQKLRSVNDQNELHATFDTDYPAFKNSDGQLEKRYRKMFQSCRVLCLSQKNSVKMFQQYCGTVGTKIQRTEVVIEKYNF